MLVSSSGYSEMEKIHEYLPEKDGGDISLVEDDIRVSADKDDLRKVPCYAGLSLVARALLLLSSICHLVTMTMPKTAKLARNAYGKIARNAEGSIMSIGTYHEYITIKGY